MSYIDGFVIAVPTVNKQKFIEHARQLDPIFIELGAIRVIEGWGDDIPDGKVTGFRGAVQATDQYGLRKPRPSPLRLALDSLAREGSSEGKLHGPFFPLCNGLIPSGGIFGDRFLVCLF